MPRTGPEPVNVTTIAIVDDHSIARAGAELLLSVSQDLRVVASVATVGELEGLSDHPDVVVLDLAVRHPADSCDEIGALAEHSAVLVISGYGDGRDLVAAFRAGALGLVTRDTEPGDFVAAVRAAARGSLYAAATVTMSVAAELRQQGQANRGGLARREIETLRLLAYGYTHAQIARRLGLAEATVNTYVRRIRGKLRAGNKAELTRMAIELGYATPASREDRAQPVSAVVA
jgi:DNA-binding NarL/FixJ family response regulator